MTDLQLLALHHRVACQGAARRTRLPEGFLPLAAEGLPAGGQTLALSVVHSKETSFLYELQKSKENFNNFLDNIFRKVFFF